MPTKTNTVSSIVSRAWRATVDRPGASPPHRLSVNSSLRKAKITTTMKMPIGTVLATVAMVFSAAACLTPRSTSACTPHSIRLPLAMATAVEPSPKAAMNCPSVALISIRQARQARQQAIQ